MADRSASAPPTTPQLVPSDPVQFAENMAEVTRLSARLSAAVSPDGAAEHSAELTESGNEVAQTFASVWQSLLVNPERFARAQTDLWHSYFTLCDYAARRMAGEDAAPPTDRGASDKRFKDDAWQSTGYDVLRQGYHLLDEWARKVVGAAEGLDEHTRHKAGFYLNQLLSAASPSNYLATNPELLHQTMMENGANLVRGLKALERDLEAGGGTLKLKQTDTSPFTLGENIAATPGSVIFRNHLCEVIQYAPTTSRVQKRPLLFVPPWINKFYVLDLNEEKSLIRWLVAEGHTVFVISWANPDERHARLDFTDYMRDGIMEAIDVVTTSTGEAEITAIGYCIGGTLLAATLAWMAAEGDRRVASASFLTTQVDFTHAGDMKVFIDEAQIEALERQMARKGYLDASSMATTFNMLRPDDLIWSTVVNNYIKGQEPFPFDLLYWNSDATRMPAANHAFYLRHCYLRNDLSEGRMEIGGRTVDLGDITVPVYSLAAREDHIAPARSVYTGLPKFGGETVFVMSGSGHIAGVVNPPSRDKYQYWAGEVGELTFDEWVDAADETPGSWWPHWHAWLMERNGETIPARKPGGGAFEPIEPAPGAFVRETS